MWKAGVQFESTSISPSGVHVELTGIANRVECLVTEATGLRTSGALDLCNGLLHLLLAAWPSMETGEQEDLHLRDPVPRC